MQLINQFSLNPLNSNLKSKQNVRQSNYSNYTNQNKASLSFKSATPTVIKPKWLLFNGKAYNPLPSREIYMNILSKIVEKLPEHIKFGYFPNPAHMETELYRTKNIKNFNIFSPVLELVNESAVGKINLPVIKMLGPEGKHVNGYVVAHNWQVKNGDNYRIVREKIDLLLKETDKDDKIILCIGEVDNEDPFKAIEKQFRYYLKNVKKEDMDRFIFSYEQGSAISEPGKQQIKCTPEAANERIGHAKELLAKKYGKDVADKSTFLVGGGIDDTNIAEMLAQPNIDGAFIASFVKSLKGAGKIFKAFVDRGKIETKAAIGTAIGWQPKPMAMS